MKSNGIIARLAIAAILSSSAGSMAAGYRNVVEFGGPGDEGRIPRCGVTVYQDKLYGMTAEGGVSNVGLIYAVSPDGSGYSVLHEFKTGKYDGGAPAMPLLEDGGLLYGVTRMGGVSNLGVLFSIEPNGSGFTNLFSFGVSSEDGANPVWPLLKYGDRIFSTTPYGGVTGSGTVFSIKSDGSAYSNLHQFGTIADDGSLGGGLTAYNGRLFGTTYRGGTDLLGAIYSCFPDGSDYQVLHSFTWAAKDGLLPLSSLVEIDGRLYGNTFQGGIYYGGTLYSIMPDGSDFQVMSSYVAGSGYGAPNGPLAYHNGRVYGTAAFGGAFGGGLVYSLKPDGSDMLPLYSFTIGNEDGAFISSQPLVFHDDVIYGTTDRGGYTNEGVLFSIESSIGIVEPASSPLPGGNSVFIGGYNLGNGSDIHSVTLAGVPAVIVEQASDRLMVRPGSASTEGRGDVVVQSGSVGETRINGRFCYSPYYVNDAAPYDWIEIATNAGGDGTAITGLFNKDDAITNIPLSFPFDFFGEEKTSIYVCCNGYLTFTNASVNYGICIPNTNLPNDFVGNMVADITGETNYSPKANVFYKTIGTAPERMMVIEYYQYTHRMDPEARFTFQTILYEGSHDIKIQYKSMIDGTNLVFSGGAGSVIGIENATGDIGTDWNCGRVDAISNGMALLFYRDAGGISGLNPDYGPQYGGNTIVIEGEKLGNGSDISAVTLAGVESEVLPGQSATQVSVRANAATMPGESDVVVYSDQLGASTLANAYTYDPWFQPRLAWDATTGATWYWLWISKDGHTYYSDWLQGQTGWQAAWEMYPVEYTWWIQPWGESIGYGAWSTGETLTIPWPNFSWNEAADATWYQLWVGRFGQEYYSRWLEGTTNWTPSWAFSPGDYTLWIQPWGPSIGYGAWSQFDAFTVAGKPLVWDSTSAPWYWLWINRDGSEYYNVWIQGQLHATLDWRLSPGVYDWWVQPWTETSADGPWSETQQFSYYGVAPSQVSLIEPSGAVPSTRPSFRWTGSGESWYRLWISRGGVEYYSEWINLRTQWSPPWDFDPGIFEWWIRPWNDYGYGPWSAGETFSLP